ncbi:hypothetical protein DUNSADRAFT_14137 [Dunaliella salina]|uniref:Uncharacterized protein n=1 Tax=Dunaliella salina TaxID=3046 RepID=A0ABQ7G7Y3_DUNSA|nr:hypothetical protein DUNSADRAFT_14137 [Dunaliella salina]|eukprot:KAF5830706.1 hypothetical protein DUNSADRAFT_14137 [Dunaliella salina]
MLQYPRCARPQPGGGGLSEQDTQGTRSWYPPPHTPLHPSSAPSQEESMAASPGRSPYGDSIQFGEFVLPLGPPAPPAQLVSAQPAPRTPSATTVARGSSRSGSARPKSRIHTPSFLHSRQVDPYTGMSLSTVHEQAISTWKDLGSLSAAQEYVEQLPPGQVNVTFSAAGLATLPDLSRLMFMESLAASFNSFHMCPDPQAILGSKPLTHLSVLCMSHCGLTELPCNIGHLLPALTELNLAHNSITELPLSLFQCSKLRAISLEHNQLCTLPDEVSRLSVLEALYLGSNSLQALPGCLPCLQMLGVLDVKRNEIKELPANLPACTQLVVLSVAYNRLTALPPSFLDALSNLRWLELQGNSLRSCPQVNGTQVAAAVVAQDAALTHTAQAHTAATEARAASLPEQAHSQEQTSGKGVHRHGRTRGPQEQLLHRRRAKGRLLAPAEDAGGEESCGTAAKREAESEQPDEPAPLVEAPLESAAPGQDLKSLQQQQQQQQQALQASSSPAKIQKTTSFSENLHARAHRAPSSSILENEAAQEVLAKSTPCRLPNLHWLNLANNRLGLPPLWLPSNLKGLDLSWNRLSNVPAWLVDSLPQLQMLALHGNCITEVCRDIKRLSSLKMVSLNENPVTDPGNAESGSWVSECVCTAKFDHKLHLEAELQRGKLGEREPSRLSS